MCAFQQPLAVGDKVKVTGGITHRGTSATITKATAATYILKTENRQTFRKYKNNIKGAKANQP